MTVEEVRERVNQVKAMAGDYEIAHGEEDDLFREVLHAIADGRCKDPAACAQEVLETGRIEFPRYTA